MAGEEETRKKCATCPNELPEGWKHEHCRECYERWVAGKAEEATDRALDALEGAGKALKVICSYHSSIDYDDLVEEFHSFVKKVEAELQKPLRERNLGGVGNYLFDERRRGIIPRANERTAKVTLERLQRELTADGLLGNQAVGELEELCKLLKEIQEYLVRGNFRKAAEIADEAWRMARPLLKAGAVRRRERQRRERVSTLLTQFEEATERGTEGEG